MVNQFTCPAFPCTRYKKSDSTTTCGGARGGLKHQAEILRKLGVMGKLNFDTVSTAHKKACVSEDVPAAWAPFL